MRLRTLSIFLIPLFLLSLGLIPAADRVYMLTAMIDQAHNIDDPVWGTEETYRSTVKELEDLLDRGFERIVELAIKAN